MRWLELDILTLLTYYEIQFNLLESLVILFLFLGIVPNY